MEDSQFDAAMKQLDDEARDDDFITALQERICAEIEPYLWSNSEEPHDLKKAESIIEEHTGTAYDIPEILFDLLDSPNHNNQQIYGFIEDLLYSNMNNDSALELASILTDYVTENVDSIIEHHTQDYDGPDSDEEY